MRQTGYPLHLLMLLVQLTGLSGAGKTTLAENVRLSLEEQGLKAVVLDGDAYRKTLCSDLGFSREDRCENIRRLGKAAHGYVVNGHIAIIAAINPFEEVRRELQEKYDAQTVWIKCDLGILLQRDTKGLYKRALLPDDDPAKIFNLTGINDVYELPLAADLIIDTGNEMPEQSASALFQFILGCMK